eukprot:7390492-Prymnesium_polylepis.1
MDLRCKASTVHGASGVRIGMDSDGPPARKGTANLKHTLALCATRPRGPRPHETFRWPGREMPVERQAHVG